MDTNAWINLCVAIGTALLAIAAFVGIIQARSAAADARAEADKDRKHSRDERTREYILDRAVRISEAYERWHGRGAGKSEARATICACLYALPVRELQVLRWEFEVYPDGRLKGMIDSYNVRDTGPTKARAEIMGLIQRLTDRGPEDDYEPIGSPTADRPFHPESG